MAVAAATATAMASNEMKRYWKENEEGSHKLKKD
jgi:hypothetical protein